MGIPENIKTRVPDISENSTTEYLQPSGINQCVKKSNAHCTYTNLKVEI